MKRDVHNFKYLIQYPREESILVVIQDVLFLEDY
jgi:hypothetical protein